MGKKVCRNEKSLCKAYNHVCALKACEILIISPVTCHVKVIFWFVTAMETLTTIKKILIIEFSRVISIKCVGLIQTLINENEQNRKRSKPGPNVWRRKVQEIKAFE